MRPQKTHIWRFMEKQARKHIKRFSITGVLKVSRGPFSGKRQSVGVSYGFQEFKNSLFPLHSAKNADFWKKRMAISLTFLRKIWAKKFYLKNGSDSHLFFTKNRIFRCVFLKCWISKPLKTASKPNHLLFLSRGNTDTQPSKIFDHPEKWIRQNIGCGGKHTEVVLATNTK